MCLILDQSYRLLAWLMAFQTLLAVVRCRDDILDLFLVLRKVFCPCFYQDPYGVWKSPEKCYLVC